MEGCSRLRVLAAFFEMFNVGAPAADETVYSMPQDEKRFRSSSDVPRAIPMGYSIAACDEEGFCRRLNQQSRLRGEGRFAFLLAISDKGERNLGCRASTDSQGLAYFKEECLKGTRFILLDDEATLTVIEGGRISDRGESVLSRAPRPACRVRIKRAGLPVSGATVIVKYPSFTLTPNDLLAGASSGSLLFYQSDLAGEISLQGVDSAKSVWIEVQGGDGGDYPLPSLPCILDVELN